MLIAQGTKNRTRNFELGGGLESGDGGDCVAGVEEVKKQVSAKGGKTHCGRPHEARNLLCNIVKKFQQVHVIYPEQIDFTNFQILEAPIMSNTPWAFFVLFSSIFPESNCPYAVRSSNTRAKRLTDMSTNTYISYTVQPGRSEHKMKKETHDS